jgi:hypothetical protein
MEVVLAIFGPTLGFGLFALLALRYGAESRPGFDERPVRDDRPNWFPIPRAAPQQPAQRSGGGHPDRVAPAPRPAPIRPAPAAARAAPAPARAAAVRPAAGEA